MNVLRRVFRGRGQAWRGALIVGLTLGCLVGTLVLLSLTLGSVGRVKDVAAIVQSGVAAVAIVAGGIFAYYKLQLFRDLEPHLTITHEVSHRFVGESYVHLAVTARLHNSSKVKIELREAFFSLLKVAPATDEDMERLYGEVFVDEVEEHLQWPVLSRIERAWLKDHPTVEPGEQYQEICEFIVSADVESATIYTYFPNSMASQDIESARGWSATTVYDIIPRITRAEGGGGNASQA